MNKVAIAFALIGAANALYLPAVAAAQTAALVNNAVIIDNAPLYSVGPEDNIGGGNYALNYATFIDIP